MKRRPLVAIALGTLLAILVLEVSVSLAYKAFVWTQARNNSEQARVPGAEGRRTLTILAIGESTTALAGNDSNTLLISGTSYPAQLERILNSSQERIRYRVMNQGILSGNSTRILDELEGNIQKFRPDIIVAMMGIIDEPETSGPGPGAFGRVLSKSRTYQLILLLRDALALRRSELRATAVTRYEDIPESFHATLERRMFRLQEIRMLEDSGWRREAELQLRLATYFWLTGQREQAEREFTEAIERFDVGYGLFAKFQEESEKPAGAEATLLRALRSHPEDGVYRASLAEHYMDTGKLGRADAILRQAPRSFPEPGARWSESHLILARARLLKERGNPAAAIRLVEEIAKSKNPPEMSPYFFPIAFSYHRALGEFHLLAGNPAKSEEHLRSSIRIAPRQHSQVALLARVLRAQGKIEEEKRVRLENLTRNFRAADVYELAKVYQEWGEKEKVAGLMDEISERIPSLIANYGKLRRIAHARGIRLVLMQYPTFGLELLKLYAQNDAEIAYVDNERIFEGGRPDEFFFEARFPYLFAHYTKQGARLVAENLARTILSLPEAVR